jgi:hypothetical protein
VPSLGNVEVLLVFFRKLTPFQSTSFLVSKMSKLTFGELVKNPNICNNPQETSTGERHSKVN